jgi:hypothetical protein
MVVGGIIVVSVDFDWEGLVVAITVACWWGVVVDVGNSVECGQCT